MASVGTINQIKLPNNDTYDIVDTGATSVQITGNGNAITDASYDATNRKITLTKDATYLASSLKGAANGLAELDSNGKVPTSQLPSYVDDVLEYTAKANFPATGETGKIYVDKTTNLTWRWGGSAYVEISPSLALGTTSSTAFAGDKGAAAYAHAVTNKGIAANNGLYKITTNSEGHVTAVDSVTQNDIADLGMATQEYAASFAATAITLEKVDEICATTIYNANGVKF